MYKLEYLPVARKDMLEIVRYISGELQNPDAADRLAVELVDAAESVLTFPYATPAYQPIRPLSDVLLGGRRKKAGDCRSRGLCETGLWPVVGVMEMGKLVEVTLEIDAELKEQAEKVCMENGLTLEEATVLFFEETVRLGRFPFELDEELREYMVE